MGSWQYRAKFFKNLVRMVILHTYHLIRKVCMKKLYSFNVGDVVEDQQVIEIIPPVRGSYRSTTYKVVCLKCGRTKIMTGPCLAIKRGTSHSACGRGLKLANKRFHSLWCAMRTRTTNVKQDHWLDYGGRGISSEAFANFIDFYDQMYEGYLEAAKQYGEKNVSLERIDVDGDYTKENCTWIHINDQKGNQRTTVMFEIQFPDGRIEVHKNVRKFALEHSLNPSCLMDLINGRLKTYKGYKAHRIKEKV